MVFETVDYIQRSFISLACCYHCGRGGNGLLLTLTLALALAPTLRNDWRWSEVGRGDLNAGVCVCVVTGVGCDSG